MTILAGEVYSFSYTSWLFDNQNFGVSASASGKVQLVIGAQIASGVPDSSTTFGLLGAGVLFLVVFSRRRVPRV